MIREVAEQLVLRRIAVVFILALACVAVLQGIATLAVASRKPRSLYVPESTLIKPREAR